MSWFHGPADWAEVERILSGRSKPQPAEPAAGRSSAGRAKRSGTFLPPAAAAAPAPGSPGAGEPGAPGIPGTEETGPAYAELHAHTAYSFLDGASEPEELVAVPGIGPVKVEQFGEDILATVRDLA